MSQQHATDVISLVFGTIFAGFTAIWVLDATGHLNRDGAWWAGPVVLVLAGAAGLVASFRPGRTQPGQERSPEA